MSTYKYNTVVFMTHFHDLGLKHRLEEKAFLNDAAVNIPIEQRAFDDVVMQNRQNLMSQLKQVFAETAQKPVPSVAKFSLFKHQPDKTKTEKHLENQQDKDNTPKPK